MIRLAALLAVVASIVFAQPHPPPERMESFPPEIWAEESAELPVPEDQLEVPVGVRAVRGIVEFGFDMVRELALSDLEQNVFISPTSVAMALGMAHSGAAGTTRDGMGMALRLHGMTPDEVGMAFADAIADLTSVDPKVRVDVANSAWAREGIAFSEQFLQSARDYFAAEVQKLDFSSPKAPGTINEWVKDNTGGRIPGIIESIDPDDVLFLVNAVYFKGTWTTAFDKKLTEDRAFHLGDGQTVEVPMMSRQSEFDYFEDPMLQVVRLPYGDGRLAMYVLLPRRIEMEEFGIIGEDGEVIAEPGPMPDLGLGIEELVGRLNYHEWTMWMEGLEEREGTVMMPKLKLEYGETLNEALKALGMAEAFDPGMADFSGMLSDPGAGRLHISEVKHKTLVEVNEEGTEAAAATSVGVKLTAMPSEEPFRMIVDRPFGCMIADRKSGAVLFAGVIRDPTQD